MVYPLATKITPSLHSGVNICARDKLSHKTLVRLIPIKRIRHSGFAYCNGRIRIKRLLNAGYPESGPIQFRIPTVADVFNYKSVIEYIRYGDVRSISSRSSPGLTFLVYWYSIGSIGQNDVPDMPLTWYSHRQLMRGCLVGLDRIWDDMVYLWTRVSDRNKNKDPLSYTMP